MDPNDELKPLPSEKARVVRYGSSTGTAGQASGAADASRTRTREERIGLGL